MMTGEEKTQVVVEVIMVTQEVMISKAMALVLKAVVIGSGCFEESLADHFHHLYRLSGGY